VINLKINNAEAKSPSSESKRVDSIGRVGLLILAAVCAFIAVLIAVFLLVESLPALYTYGLGIFSSTDWNPYIDRFGIFVFVVGSLWVSGFALIFALPLGLATSIFLAEYCPPSLRYSLRTAVELMAAIPSIVYGLWGFMVLVPWLRYSGEPFLRNNFGFIPFFSGEPQGYGVLAGSLLLAIMLLPTIVAISEDAFRMLPSTLREASMALGASKTETTFKIVLPAALPGIAAAVLLSLGRALGETMAVLMVTGNTMIIPKTLFDPTYVMTSVIANQLGYAFATPLYRSALFVVALALLIVSICFTATARILLRYAMKSRSFGI